MQPGLIPLVLRQLTQRRKEKGVPVDGSSNESNQVKVVQCQGKYISLGSPIRSWHCWASTDIFITVTVIEPSHKKQAAQTSLHELHCGCTVQLNRLYPYSASYPGHSRGLGQPAAFLLYWIKARLAQLTPTPNPPADCRTFPSSLYLGTYG